MSKKKEITLVHREGWITRWRNSDQRGLVDVDVYSKNVFTMKEELVLEWSYGKACGPSLMGNALFWLDQVILQTKAIRDKDVIGA